MPSSLLRRLALTALLAIAPVGLLAQTHPLRDPALRALAEAGRIDDLDRAARERAGRAPGDADAAIAQALVATDRGALPGLDAVVPQVQQCIQQHPLAAGCHYALGLVQARRALQGGMTAALRLAGDVRKSLQRALELEPLLYPARELLLTYYLQAPSIAGGGVDKARALAEATTSLQPDHARLLRSAVLAKEGRWSDAERELAPLRPGPDRSLADGLLAALANLGFAHASDGRPAQAQPLFERLLRDYPAHAAGAYGLGRVMLMLGRADDAVRLMERARGLEGADRMPIDHRLGEAMLAQGDKAGARVALQRFVDNARPGRTNPRNLEAARKLLAELA